MHSDECCSVDERLPTPAAGGERAATGESPAATLQEARERKGMTRRSFGRTVLASESSVRRWERAERAPRAEDVTRIAAALEVPEATVWSWVGEAPRHGKEALSSVQGLRRLRVEAGLDRPKLAAEMGVSVQTVAHWERGRRALPCHRLDRLAMVLRLTRSNLIRELAVAPIEPRVPALRRMRIALGLTQRAAAMRIGISSALLGRWESGGAIPSWPHIRSAAAAYGVPVHLVARSVGQDPPTFLDPRRWGTDNLGSVLRELRAWRGETLVAIADQIGVDPQTVRRWEQGRSRPKPSQLASLQNALGLGCHLPLVTGVADSP